MTPANATAATASPMHPGMPGPPGGSAEGGARYGRRAMEPEESARMGSAEPMQRDSGGSVSALARLKQNQNNARVVRPPSPASGRRKRGGELQHVTGSSSFINGQ